MMISKESYVSNKKNDSIADLILDRNELLKSISNYENKFILKTESFNEEDFADMQMKPGPELVYKFNNSYLIEISKLIKEKLEVEQDWISQLD